MNIAEKIVRYPQWKPGTPGVVAGMPPGLYHLADFGLGRSIAAKLIYDSPAHAKAKMLSPKEPTKFMEMGTLVHLAMLEPEKLKGSYFVRPECNSNGDEWHGNKTWCKKWNDEHVGKPVLSADDERNLIGCVCALRENKTMAGMLEVGFCELSVFVEYQGIMLKCRPDLVATDKDGKTWVLDIKKCQSASPALFAHQSKNLHRDFQDAFYRMVLTLAGFEVHQFIFAAVEEKPPHGVGLFRISAQNISQVQRDVQFAIDRYIECSEKDEWPGYPGAIQEIGWKNYVTE